MTMPVDNSSVPVGDIPSSSNTSGVSSLLAPDTFLNLLVDELKYQNPLDPTSSADFMNQIAELSQVEQLQTVSSSSQLGEAEGLIGEVVAGNDASGKFVAGVVTGVTTTSNGPEVDFSDGDTISLTSVTQIGSAGSAATDPTTPTS
ncbi:MAG TPA: flagellar hook capping FlgD N-terminal domain-containing protein [Acidimicrobiales bacterium]|jgi:flagellar basal-body rod modification protein FlgD|nr:flagellar hook capping FlgD N-terminal domain-containing protein [Acidimicrobiales bacterium]